MDHLACFVPGMLALGAMWDPTNPLYTTYMENSLELMKTCYEIYARQATGLGPEIVRFDDPLKDFRNHASHYILRPEAVESLFILWRVTHEQKYREWGWKIYEVTQ